MKEIVERILKAEEDSKAMERDARDEAKRRVEEGRKAAADIVSRARKDAQEEAQRRLDGAGGTAESERAKILADAAAGAQAIRGNQGAVDSAVIEQAARRISGLEE